MGPEFPKPPERKLRLFFLKSAGMTTEEIAEQENLDARHVRKLVSHVIKHYNATNAIHAYAIAISCGHLSPQSVTWRQQWEEYYQRQLSSQESSE